MNPLTKLERVLISVAVLAIGLIAFGWYERGVEKDKLEKNAAKDRMALVQKYATQEADWRHKLDISTGEANAAKTQVEALSVAIPARSVVACVQRPARQTTPMPEARSADRGHAGGTPSNGLLPNEPRQDSEGSGVPLIDAGPRLKANDELCEALSRRLASWQRRYKITEE